MWRTIYGEILIVNGILGLEQSKIYHFTPNFHDRTEVRIWVSIVLNRNKDSIIKCSIKVTARLAYRHTLIYSNFRYSAISIVLQTLKMLVIISTAE